MFNEVGHIKEDSEPDGCDYLDIHSHMNMAHTVPINSSSDVPLHLMICICRWVAVDCDLG